MDQSPPPFWIDAIKNSANSESKSFNQNSVDIQVY